MAASIIDQLKAVKAYEARLAAARAAVPSQGSTVRPVYGDPDSSQSGTIIGYAAYGDPDSGGGVTPVDASYAVPVPVGNEGFLEYRFDDSKYLADKVGPRPTIDVGALRAAKEIRDIDKSLAALGDEYNREASSDGGNPHIAQAQIDKLQQRKAQLGKQPNVGGTFSEALKLALDAGVDLRPLYGETYADAVRFKQDLGQYVGKDQSMIIPANPVGYGGQFKFDPNFGSTFYRDLATQAGKALGLNDQQILQKGTEYFADKFASGPSTKGIIGFTDFGTGLMDTFAQAAGVPAERLGELKGTALKPLYDASSQVFQGLNGAARIESQSSGFFKGIGAGIAKLGPLGTIALTAALGPAGAGLSTALAAGTAAALPGLLQGDIKGGLTSGALAGLSAGALKGIGTSVSSTAGGGALGNTLGGIAQGATSGGIGSLLTGGDLGRGLLSGAFQGGIGGLLQPVRSVGGIDDSNYDLGRSSEQFLGMGGGPAVGGIDDSNFDLGKSSAQMDFLTRIPGVVGGIDDSEFDLGKSSESLDRLQNSVSGPSFKPNVSKLVNPLINALLAGGAGAAVASGIGALGGSSSRQNVGQPGPSSLALNPTALNRGLGFQFEAPQYTAGVGGQTLQMPQYNVVNPQPPQAPGYIRGFAEGGEIEAVNGGLGSIPMAGRFLQGPGDGMSDDIPANIDGQEDVMLTDGEYIVPAQAVSALGNGSSKAGAQVLDAMVKRVYTEQTGRPEQMKPINKKVLPA